jgi:uncharacterized protein
MSASDAEAGVRAAWAARDARLRDRYGWLSLAGLWWLHAGANRFGADPSNEIVLRGEGVPPMGGIVELDGGEVRLRPQDPRVTLDGEPAEVMTLHDDVDGEPTAFEVGRLRIHVIRRGDRVALRVRDPDAAAFSTFQGMQHYPVDRSWRVTAHLAPGDDDEVEIVDVTGLVSREAVAGYLSFEHAGRSLRLATLPGGPDGRLWLIFGDATNGSGTYGGGRYLYTDPVGADGSVVADFNLAFNPPCVFTPYATCPLPPLANRLPIPIEAGERAFHLA